MFHSPRQSGFSSTSIRRIRWSLLSLEEPEPEPEKDNRDQGEDRRYQPTDHPKAIRAAAERNAADVHAPDARGQGCRQEYHREHREYIKVSVGFLPHLRAQLFERN